MTVEANRLQSGRDPAQQELADWVRFSGRAAAARRDGLTTAGMEMVGVIAWTVRNFNDRDSVPTVDFRRRGLDTVAALVARSAGWLLVASRTPRSPAYSTPAGGRSGCASGRGGGGSLSTP